MYCKYCYFVYHNTGSIKKFGDQVRIRLISPLISCVSIVLRELLRYFNATIISTSFLPSFPVWLVIFFNLNEILSLLAGKSKILPALYKAASFL